MGMFLRCENKNKNKHTILVYYSLENWSKLKINLLLNMQQVVRPHAHIMQLTNAPDSRNVKGRERERESNSNMFVCV